LTTSALVCAAPKPPIKQEAVEQHLLGYKYAETGNSWTVDATANGTSTEGAVIHLLQSRTHPYGDGAVFIADGRFPIARRICR
jgi:hypothetical protein